MTDKLNELLHANNIVTTEEEIIDQIPTNTEPNPIQAMVFDQNFTAATHVHIPIADICK